MIKISIIVPFHNSLQYIEDCITGLLSQNYPKEAYEVIMVDNNSSDASAEIVRKYDRIKLISEEKPGPYAARNKGISEAKGEIVAFTDSDCVPCSDWLREIEAAMTNPGTGIVVGSHRFARDTFLLSLLEAYENERSNYVFNSMIKEIYYGHNNNMAVRKRLFDEIGPFVERSRGADTIFVQRCVDRYSSEIVRYSSKIMIRHLEIHCLSKLFHKYFIYGHSRRKYKTMVSLRPLKNWERFQIFGRTVQGHSFSWIKASLLLVLLVIGLIFWALGDVNPYLNLRRMVD